MMQLLKQSTAATVLVGPVSSADAAYTGAAIGDFNITKNGTTAALASPATATHSHNGYYLIALGTGNVDTLGRVDISLNATAYFMTLHRYTVVTANQFDALITNGTATPAANADATLSGLTSGPTTGGNWPNGSFGRRILVGSSTQREVAVTGSNHVAADIHDLQPAVITAADFATDAISADAVSSGAVDKIVTGVWSALTSGLSVVGSTGRALARLIGLVQDNGGDEFTVKALNRAPTGGGGSGQYAITLVASSTSGNVRGVVFSIAGTATRVETGTSGQAVLNLDAGTYTLRTTPPSGWEAVADSPLVVAADATVTKTLVAVGYTPSNPPGCTVTIPVRSQYTTALSGVEVKLKFIAWDAGATKPATILSPPPVQTSDSSGVITVVLYRQAKYTATYTIPGDTVRVVPFTVPNASTYTVVEP